MCPGKIDEGGIGRIERTGPVMEKVGRELVSAECRTQFGAATKTSHEIDIKVRGSAEIGFVRVDATKVTAYAFLAIAGRVGMREWSASISEMGGEVFTCCCRVERES